VDSWLDPQWSQPSKHPVHTHTHKQTHWHTHAHSTRTHFYCCSHARNIKSSHPTHCQMLARGERVSNERARERERNNEWERTSKSCSEISARLEGACVCVCVCVETIALCLSCLLSFYIASSLFHPPSPRTPLALPLAPLAMAACHSQFAGQWLPKKNTKYTKYICVDFSGSSAKNWIVTHTHKHMQLQLCVFTWTRSCLAGRGWYCRGGWAWGVGAMLCISIKF